MINVRQYRRGQQSSEINISPLIDLIFLLLIFFMVTTSFVKETGIEVERPAANTAELKEHGTILVGISAENSVHMDGRQIDLRAVRPNVGRALAENPEGSVIIVSDKGSTAGVVIDVMDQCRLAGAVDVSLAASRGGS